MAYGQILPKGVLDAANLACLNLHACLLPRWRGAAPIQAAIDAGDEKTGITVMYMDEGLDTGDILLMREVNISPDETGGVLHDRLAEKRPAHSQSQSRFSSRRRAARFTACTRRHLCRQTHARTRRSRFFRRHIAVGRKVRAMNPWPAAATRLAGKRLKIFSAKPLATPSARQARCCQRRWPAHRHRRRRGARYGPPTRRQTPDACSDFLHGHSIAPGTKRGS